MLSLCILFCFIFPRKQLSLVISLINAHSEHPSWVVSHLGDLGSQFIFLPICLMWLQSFGARQKPRTGCDCLHQLLRLTTSLLPTVGRRLGCINEQSVRQFGYCLGNLNCNLTAIGCLFIDLKNTIISRDLESRRLDPFPVSFTDSFYR